MEREGGRQGKTIGCLRDALGNAWATCHATRQISKRKKSVPEWRTATLNHPSALQLFVSPPARFNSPLETFRKPRDNRNSRCPQPSLEFSRVQLALVAVLSQITEDLSRDSYIRDETCIINLMMQINSRWREDRSVTASSAQIISCFRVQFQCIGWELLDLPWQK